MSSFHASLEYLFILIFLAVRKSTEDLFSVLLMHLSSNKRVAWFPHVRLTNLMEFLKSVSTLSMKKSETDEIMRKHRTMFSIMVSSSFPYKGLNAAVRYSGLNKRHFRPYIWERAYTFGKIALGL